MAGCRRLPCAKTLGIEFVEIDGERGTVEVKFEAKPEFLNPAGNVQGGFLAAMLDDTMGPALTRDAGRRRIRADASISTCSFTGRPRPGR